MVEETYNFEIPECDHCCICGRRKTLKNLKNGGRHVVFFTCRPRCFDKIKEMTRKKLR